jgi:hypothetical protein
MAKVQVIIEEIVKGAGNIDGVTKDLKDLNQTADKSQSFTQRASTSFTEFNSALSLVKMGLQAGQQAWRATVDEMVVYGDQVKKLQTITGQSSEAVSNQIQLADDARVSYESLTVAMRTASKKGIDTTMSGLANLADEYKKLNPGIERTQFLMKNFGRGGLEMAKILEMDSKAIKDFKANAGQILSETDMRNLKAYNHSLDVFRDNLESVKGEASKKLVVFGTEFLDGLNATSMALGIVKDKHVSLSVAMDMAIQEIAKEKAAFLATGDAAADTGDSVDDLVDSQKAAEDEAKRLTGIYQGLLSSMFDIQKGNEGLASTLQKADEKEAELNTKKAEVLGEYLKKKQEIDASNESGAKKQQQNTEATVAYAKALADLDKDLAANTQSKVDAQKELEDAGKKRVYDLTQQKLAADGVVSTGEYEYLQKLAVSMGLVTQSAADQAIAENQRADALVKAFIQIENPMQRDLALMQQINGYNGTTVQFGVNYQSNMPGSAPKYTAPKSYGGVGGIPPVTGLPRDSGGSGVAGTPYMIGTGAQPEMFVPNSNGTFIPNANKMGATYNITINNPKKETAENSIRSALKKLSFTGVAA